MQQFNVVIAGGGTAGWMTAAALSRFLPKATHSIHLVESEQIGTVGVGEATIPHIRQFNAMLGIDENDFMRATQATYKLGIQFDNWGGLGESYIHPFGSSGQAIGGIDFHHHWLKLQATGNAAPFDDYSVAVAAAKRKRFSYPVSDHNSPRSSYTYAFHLDASLYAQFLRQYAQTRGVVRSEGKILGIERAPANGNIQALLLDHGQRLQGDLFIDCTGFAALLIEQQLHTGFDSWQHWLPCDRAVAVPCAKIEEPLPYTKATARTAGWQWRIPLQHRTGNGYVYASEFISDSQAEAELLSHLDGALVAEPKVLHFTAGQRRQSWNKNCVAIGLSSGFLEPLESTSIYLIQLSLLKLLEFFPQAQSESVARQEFNRAISLEYQLIRDFLILHYHLTQRDDTAFWRYCRTMDIPESLQRKMALFKQTAHIEEYQQGLFMPPSWLAVYLGQGCVPEHYDPRLEAMSIKEGAAGLAAMKNAIDQSVATMPEAADFLRASLAGSNSGYPQAAMSLYGVKR
jgi:tryptophan 7-halogenase